MINTDRTVWVDMDGTIVDFDGAALQVVPLEQRTSRQHFYIANDYSEPLRSQVEAHYSTPGFFVGLELFPGVIEGWQALVDAGYHPRILSSPLASNPACKEEKLESLKRLLVPHFGPSAVDEAVIDTEKWKYPGLALIDDRPDAVRGSMRAPWMHVLYGWPHMDTVSDTTAQFRMRNWDEVHALIDKLNELTSGR